MYKQGNCRLQTSLPAFIILHAADHQPLSARRSFIANSPGVQFAAIMYEPQSQAVWRNLGNMLEIYDYLSSRIVLRSILPLPSTISKSRKHDVIHKTGST